VPVFTYEALRADAPAFLADYAERLRLAVDLQTLDGVLEAQAWYKSRATGLCLPGSQW